MTQPTAENNSILIWDLPLRLFHWTLVASIAWSWIAIEFFDNLQQHFYAGYVTLTLLLFRVAWGFAGSYYSQFKRLFFSPKESLVYARGLFANSSKRYAGHSPIGSYAVIALLGFLLVQVTTGLFSTDEYYFGPLASLVGQARMEQLTDLHKANFEWLQAMIVLHIIAIAVYRLVKKEPLTAAMISGRKDNQDLENSKPIKSQRRLIGLLLMLVSIAIAIILINFVAAPVELDESSFY